MRFVVTPTVRRLMIVPAALAMAGLFCRPAEGQSGSAAAQVGEKSARSNARRKPPAPFRWVNPLKSELPGVRHAVFFSEIAGTEAGYCIYLPPQYDREPQRRFPVVYYLHGGRPGSETKSVQLTRIMHDHISNGRVRPMIYVFVNGGPVSHYNVPDRPKARGADVLIKELIPHIDATYRTIADRNGRGLEGFSQGGRGTARLMFRYPELFATGAPGGAGQATEKRISEEHGRESDNLVFAEGDNTWDLARSFASEDPRPQLKIQFHVGTKGFNYPNNLEYMKFMDSLGISYDKVVVEGAAHSAMEIYRDSGLQIMRFHADHLAHDGS